MPWGGDLCYNHIQDIGREKLTTQNITIDRRKYAVGLFWQPVGVGFVARNYARSLARSVDKKLNLFTEYRAMVGLGGRKYGHRAGMAVASAGIMESLSEYSSFLAVFRVGAHYYLVAVRNGIILEDKLLETEDAARDEYVRLAEIPDWAAYIAPGEWGMPRAIERDLRDVLSAAPQARLHRISRFRAGLASTLMFATFAALLIYFFRAPIAQMMAPRAKPAQIDPEIAAEYKRRIEERNRQLDEQFNMVEPEPEPIVLPYDYLPDVAARAEICYRAIGFLMQPTTGWNQLRAECGETHASATFARTFGTIGDFYAIAGVQMPGTYIVENSENSVTARATLPAVPTHASRDERDAGTIVREIQTLFQTMDADVDVDVVTDTLSNGVDTVILDVVEVAAASKLVPMQFMEIFSDFGGVYMTRAQWNAVSRTWNYEVIIYAK